MTRLADMMRVEAAERRSEAAERLCQRRPSARLLWLAVRWAFVAEWRRSA